MQLVEQHIIKQDNQYFKEIDNLCFLSKNLYNSCLYLIRQEFIHNKNNVLYELHHRMKNTEQYWALPAKVSSNVIIAVQHNFKSFFAALKVYNINPSKFTSKPKLPYYLDKENGRFFVSYTNQAISKKVFKKTNKIKLSKSNIEFKTKINDFNVIDCIRIIPKIGYYVIEVVSTIEDIPILLNNDKYSSIYLGVNNLATVVSNIKEIKPYIINGKPLKSINQYYNKKKACLQSILRIRNKKYGSKQLNKLNLKRKCKVDNYLHKASKIIINELINNNINTLIIGKNNYWKNESRLNKTNNQNFVQIPHSRFIDMLKYKCERRGINVMCREESYTSKASFLNLDYIPSYKKNDKTVYVFSGYREHRGIYKIKNSNIKINSDVNGAYNILRKAIPNAFANGIEGIGVYPEIINILK